MPSAQKKLFFLQRKKNLADYCFCDWVNDVIWNMPLLFVLHVPLNCRSSASFEHAYDNILTIAANLLIFWNLFCGFRDCFTDMQGWCQKDPWEGSSFFTTVVNIRFPFDARPYPAKCSKFWWVRKIKSCHTYIDWKPKAIITAWDVCLCVLIYF